MEEFYRLNNPVISSYPNGDVAGEAITSTSCGIHGSMMVDDDMLQLEAEATTGLNMSDMIKTQIVNHPLYPKLVSAYIECQKVGAPPQVASLLEEIGRENHPPRSCIDLGADPQLDNFMESYCEVLHQYKNELSKPFDEATMFLTNIELELSNLCKGSFSTTSDSHSAMNDEVAGTSEEEPSSYGEVEMAGNHESFCTRQTNQDLKGMLLRKYSGYLSSLKKEFLKKRKKEKLPKDARMALFDWWNTHYKWPYPTEEEKSKLSDITGLDQKQINNWFINQRKRHWKPPEDMRFALMDDGAGECIKGSNLYDNGETGGHVI